MEIEEWLSRVLSEMQCHAEDLRGLLKMTERLSIQRCLSGYQVTSTETAALVGLARSCALSRTAWLSCAYRIGILIGPDGHPDEPVERP
jgi:hypothetical protein